MSDVNFAKTIEEEAAEHRETVIACVIGPFGWGDSDTPDEQCYGWGRQTPAMPIPVSLRGIVTPWEVARPWLDYVFYDGHGAPLFYDGHDAPLCHAVYAWTENRVIFVVEYDGATWMASVPRNPQDEMPTMHGS